MGKMTDKQLGEGLRQLMPKTKQALRNTRAIGDVLARNVGDNSEEVSQIQSVMESITESLDKINVVARKLAHKDAGSEAKS